MRQDLIPKAQSFKHLLNFSTREKNCQLFLNFLKDFIQAKPMRLSLKEFSSHIFKWESIVVLLFHMISILLVMLIGKTIGQYEINWLGVLNRSISCYIFVGITEE